MGSPQAQCARREPGISLPGRKTAQLGGISEGIHDKNVLAGLARRQPEHGDRIEYLVDFRINPVAYPGIAADIGEPCFVQCPHVHSGRGTQPFDAPVERLGGGMHGGALYCCDASVRVKGDNGLKKPLCISAGCPCQVLPLQGFHDGPLMKKHNMIT